MDSYLERNTKLLSLDFNSYSDYLKSSLWTIIRKAVLHRDACICWNVRCPNRRAKIVKQVHHLGYSYGVLLGANPGCLVTLCLDCHNLCEHDEQGTKLTLSQAISKTLHLLLNIKRRGASEKKIGHWYRNNMQASQETAREILAKIKAELPAWYKTTVTMAFEGRLGNSAVKYLGLKKGDLKWTTLS